MISGYLKSSISTVEKRFGLSSQTSGLLAAFNEVLALVQPLGGRRIEGDSCPHLLTPPLTSLTETLPVPVSTGNLTTAPSPNLQISFPKSPAPSSCPGRENNLCLLVTSQQGRSCPWGHSRGWGGGYCRGRQNSHTAHSPFDSFTWLLPVP